MPTREFNFFGDDTAADVRAAYLSQLSDGLSGPAATKAVLSYLKKDFADEDEGPIAWLALAAAQWNVGRLDERTKKQALKFIDSPELLRHLFAGTPAKLLAKRELAIQDLRKRLTSPQPAEKSFKPAKKSTGSWESWALGEYFGFVLRKGTYALLRVQGISRLGISFAVVEWMGAELPPEAEILKLPVEDEGSFTARTRSEKDLPSDRLVRLHVIKKFKRTHFSGGGVLRSWSQVPHWIKRMLKMQDVS